MRTESEKNAYVDKSGNDTIAAVATAMSAAGIGIIRVSGPDAIRICAPYYVSAGGNRNLESHASNTIVFGYIEDDDHTRLDEVMVSVFRAPHSYTTEDTVEINSHGGTFILNRILDLILRGGARLAEPGEFTKRAFLGGRIDLSRAEAVMDLISSQNEFARRTALAQLGGSVSEKIKGFRSSILYEMAFIESALDDPDSYDLDGYPERLDGICQKILDDMDSLLEIGDKGAVLKEGIRTAIIGRPNAGKSSLLNYLAGTERAIVTEIAGTTRDTLQESIRIRGIQLRVTDTAGIHETEDRVEKIGIERAKEAISQSELVLYLISLRKCILLLNKSDLPPVTEEESVRSFFGEADAILSCSLKTGEGAEELGHTIEKMYHMGELTHQSESMITSLRHREAVREAYESLSLVRQSIAMGMSEDFFAIDLMNAYTCLGRITGEAVEDDLVEEIFSKFCMGK